MSGLAQEFPHPWIAPMSLINTAYGSRSCGIRDRGVEVREFVLASPRNSCEPNRCRPGGGDGLAVVHAHISQALATFASLTDATLVDASKEPDQVAEAVMSQLREGRRCGPQHPHDR